jgi:hypothetical protein
MSTFKKVNSFNVLKMDMNDVSAAQSVIQFITTKIDYIREIIQNTILSIKSNHLLEIFSDNDAKLSIQVLTELFSKNEKLFQDVHKPHTLMTSDEMITTLQQIIDKLSVIICGFGTTNIIDLLFISFGTKFKSITPTRELVKAKYDLIIKHVRPIGYKLIHWKPGYNYNNTDTTICDNKKTDEIVDICSALSYECFDIDYDSKTLFQKTNSIRVIIQHERGNKTLVINGILDDIHLECISNKYVEHRLSSLFQIVETTTESHHDILKNIIENLTLKDIMVYGNNDIIKCVNDTNTAVAKLTHTNMDMVTQQFLEMDIYDQRHMILNLLYYKNDTDVEYMCYLLYDLLNSASGYGSNYQEMIYNSFPWKIRNQMKDIVKYNINHTQEILNKYEGKKISLEQQICLLKTSASVKEKAITKLKELKGRPDELGIKIKQFLEGLVRIPFGINKEEPILSVIKTLNIEFKQIQQNDSTINEDSIMCKKQIYTLLEISKMLTNIKIQTKNRLFRLLKEKISHISVQVLNLFIKMLYSNPEKQKRLLKQNKSTKVSTLIELFNDENIMTDVIITKLTTEISVYTEQQPIYQQWNSICKLNQDITNFHTDSDKIEDALEHSIYGHNHAKKQIMKIIGQWMNGKQSGYCFGFEGSPGIGKCFKKDTPIMLSNGKIKMVQDITTEDKLMGDDSTQRNVLALGRGREKMYHIKQVKGEDYVVNESHILSLKMTKPRSKGGKYQTIIGKRYYKNDIVDICIKDYLSLPKYLKGCLKGYKVGLYFREQDVSLEPYALGYWLGDGDKTTFRLTTIEKEVIEYFTEYACKYNLQLTKNDISYHITTGKMGGRDYNRNPLLNMLKQYNLIHNKHIPEEYKINSREKRLELLAGLIDSDGYYSPITNALEITQKNKTLADDILFLVRSLGMRGMMKECEKYCVYKGEKIYGIYHRIIITGSGLDEIPVKCPRKKAREHKQLKNCLNTGISVIPMEEDDYYGFQIDGNSRFVLGDLTVTHNTSLAKKGLTNCLIDVNGESRPFAFIAMGGSSSGSTLEGHGYTYVNSTWGRIVDILMDTKCMNPIIYIDELDKVSNTENGKEIIGILTHLIDPTQNESFQDKYFTGIDIDISNVLFIFSYNDADLIDRILLDRIHRIKFENLTLDDKMVIVRKYILPDINNKMGFDETVIMSDEIIEHIINYYTSEPGVRKLKEIIFDLFGEINLELLKTKYTTEITIPIMVTVDNIENKYLTKYKTITEKKIYQEPRIGIINGLWANILGMGGIIPIQTSFYPSSVFLDLQLTGLQGDVMKESMSVAKTLAWSLSDDTIKHELLKYFELTKCQGLHIHCPDGSISKDGPSAGAAITTAIYSLLNKKHVKNDIAITGEINLSGEITAIGGLDIKISNGIRAGIKTFLYPKENNREFTKWQTTNKKEYPDITFIEISTISQIFNHVFTDDNITV